MEWIAVMYIIGCVGLNCPVPVASLMTQPDEETCQRVIGVWRGISEKHHAVCLYGDYDKLNIVIEQTEDALTLGE